MTPGEFMAFATPVILLISQELRAHLVQKNLKRLTETQTDQINDAGQKRAQVIQSTTLDTASKLAVHTSEKASDLKEEMDDIHAMVNGTTSLLRGRILDLSKQLQEANQKHEAYLKAELANRSAQTQTDAQTAALNLAGEERAAKTQHTVTDESAALKGQIHELESQLQAAKLNP